MEEVIVLHLVYLRLVEIRIPTILNMVPVRIDTQDGIDKCNEFSTTHLNLMLISLCLGLRQGSKCYVGLLQRT